jgi:hypothetical protein
MMKGILFLGVLIALVAGCGGDDDASGGAAGSGGSAGASGSSGAAGSGGAVDPDGGYDAPPLGSTVTQVVLHPADGASEAGPTTFAQAFREGDVAHTIVAVLDDEPLPTQVNVKRRHPDGSVRHAAITVEVPPIASGQSLTLELRSADEAGDTAGPSVTDLLADGFDTKVEITEGGNVYEASAKSLLSSGAPTRWLDGPLATELRISGPLQGAAGEHPALQVVFDVRFYGSQAARVSTTIENTFDDTPGNLTYDVRIVDPEDAVLFEQAAVEHFHHARWRHVASWGKAAPAVDITHDLDYLIEIGVVPRYDTSRTVPQSAIDSLVASWEAANRGPLGNGIVTEYFPTTGGRGDIGPLPQWTATALMSGDGDALEVMNGVGALAGSFSVHYRARDTGRALSIDDHPTVTLISSAAQYSQPEDKLPSCANCDSPYTVDAAHQPSLAFVPYLLTGDSYYLDELYFWTSYNFISQNWDYRSEDEGLLQSQQVRAQAWTLRTLAHTAWIAPDGDPEQAMLEGKLDNNLAWYQANAVDSNPFGWWGAQSNWGSDGGRPDENMAADVRYYTSPWQSDFLVWAFDYIHGLGYTDAAPTRAWLAGFTVGRFTNDPDYNPYDGAPYHIAVSSDTGADYTTWSELWGKSFAGRTDPPPTELPSASCSMCYPINARVALTGAIHAGVPNAQEAYDFVTAAIEPYDEVFTEDPTWAIVP